VFVVDQIAVVQFRTPAAPGTLDITDPSITEAFHAGIFIITGFDEGTEGLDNTHGLLGIGFCTINPGVAGNEVREESAICAQMENGVFTADNGTTNLLGTCIRVPLGTAVGTGNIRAEFSAAIAGGVRLNFTTTASRAKGVAILFAGIADSFAAQFTPGAAAQRDCNGEAGGTFRPSIVFFLTHDHPGGSPDEAEAQPNIGFAIDDASVTQKLMALNIDESNPTDADGYMRSDSCIGWLDLGTRAVERAFVNSFNANGFEAQGDGNRCSFLALKFSGNARAAAANMPIAASTGLQSFNSFGFTPDLVLGMTSLLTAEDTLTDGVSAFGYFVTGRYLSRAHTARMAEGVTLVNPTQATAATTRHEEVALLQYDNDGNVVQRATWAGASGNGGFRLDFSTASASGYMTALGIQLVPNPPLPVRRIRRQRRARARIQRRQVLVGGRPVGPIPLRAGFWRAVQRIRRALRLRLRRPAPPFYGVRLTGTPTEEGSKGRVFRPGLYRGRITGAGVPTRDLDQ
jgi:hypothetical protein